MIISWVMVTSSLTNLILLEKHMCSHLSSQNWTNTGLLVLFKPPTKLAHINLIDKRPYSKVTPLNSISLLSSKIKSRESLKTASVDHQHYFSSTGNKNITSIGRLHILWAFQIKEPYINCNKKREWKVMSKSSKKINVIISKWSM